MGLRDAMERELRSALGIPFNPAAAAVNYEHSMGQTGAVLPGHILRRSERMKDSEERMKDEG